MKRLLTLLSLLLLLQSCSVYHSGTASVQEAVASENKVKIVAEDGTKYKFKKVETEEGKLVGVTRLNSSTARKIAGIPAQIAGEKLRVDLSKMAIKKIKIRNNTWSTVLNIGVPVVTAFTGLMAWVLIDMSNDDSGGMDLEW